MFETYGIYLVTLGLTACSVYYRNVLLKSLLISVTTNINVSKLRTNVLTVFKTLTAKVVSVKVIFKRFFK